MDLKAQAAQCYWSYKTSNQGASPSFALLFQGSTFVLRTMPLQKLTEESNAVLDFYMHMQEFDQNQDDMFQESIQKAMDWMRLSLSWTNTTSNASEIHRATNIDYNASDDDSLSLMRGRNEVSPDERNKQKNLKQNEKRTNTVTKYMSRDSSKTAYPNNPRRVSDQHDVAMHSDTSQTVHQSSEAKDRFASDQQSDDDIHENFDIDPYDDWKTVFKKMKKGGWTHKNGDLFHSYFYVKPGCSVKNGTMNVDYFTCEEQLQDYARKYYGWQEGLAENKKLLGQAKSQNEHDEDDGDGEAFGSEPNDEDEDLVDDSLDDHEEGVQGKQKQNVVSDMFEYEEESSKTKASIIVKNKTSKRVSNNKRKRDKMNNDVNSTALKMLKAHNKKKTSSKSSPPTPSFKEIWPRLSEMGWKCVYSKFGGEDFYRPGYTSKDANLVQGEHYFHERDELLKFIKTNDVGLDNLNDESESENDSESNVSSDASKKMRTSKVSKSKITKKTSSKSCPPTPSFKEIWPRLSEMGWKCVYSKFGGEDFYRPGYTSKDANLVQGEHYFHERDELLKFIKTNDVGLDNLNDESESENDSESHDDGDSVDISAPSPCLSESSDESSLLEPFVIEGCDDCWWNSESIPKFLVHWNVIRDKLGVTYVGGNYKTVDGETFVNPDEMLQHLNRVGISLKSMNALTDEEKYSIIRLITVSNLPKKIGSYSLNPKSSQVLLSSLLGGGSFGDDRAWAALVRYFGGQNPDGEYSLGIEHESFPHCLNLSEVREAIRKGCLNHVAGKDIEKDEAYAALILWASVLPLPIIEDDEIGGRDVIKKDSLPYLEGNDLCSEQHGSDDLNPLTQAESSSTDNAILSQEVDDDVDMASSSLQQKPPPSAQFARQKSAVPTPSKFDLLDNVCHGSPCGLSKSESDVFFNLMSVEEFNGTLNPPHEEVAHRKKILFNSSDKNDVYGTPRSHS